MVGYKRNVNPVFFLKKKTGAGLYVTASSTIGRLNA